MDKKRWPTVHIMVYIIAWAFVAFALAVSMWSVSVMVGMALNA